MKEAPKEGPLPFLTLVKTQEEASVNTCLNHQEANRGNSNALISKNWSQEERSLAKLRRSTLPRPLMNSPRNIIHTILTISECLSQAWLLIHMKAKRMRVEEINRGAYRISPVKKKSSKEIQAAITSCRWTRALTIIWKINASNVTLSCAKNLQLRLVQQSKPRQTPSWIT